MNNLKNKWILLSLITLVFSLGFLIYGSLSYKFGPQKSYVSFKEDLNKGSINEIKINENNLEVTLKDDTKYTTDNPKSSDFKSQLLEKNIKVSELSSEPLSKSIPAATLTVSIIALALIILKNKNLGAKSFSTISAEPVNFNKETAFGFHSVAGNEEAKENMSDVVDFLKTPEKYTKYGARIPKGIILYGEPGTGKTLLAKAVAGEAGVPFFAVSGSDFVQMYVGVGASRIRNLFKKAKASNKAVIFIDEIDAIGKKRGASNSSGGSDERDQTLNALLTEMSGFGESEGIVIIAATNRLDTLDSALLRPGRFDRHVEVGLPDVNSRESILNLHLKNKPSENINVSSIAKKTSGFSGAKLESLVNEAAILAAKETASFIDDNHIEKAFSIILAGQEKKDRSYIKDSDREITAYHEAGHAVVSKILLPNETIAKVSIIPTTKGAGGYTMTIPEDGQYKTLSYLENRIKVLLGGRAAEEIIFGEKNITTGAYSDLSESTKIITAMITEYGMGKELGLLKLSELGNYGSSYGTSVISEAKDLINLLYDDTKKLLSENISVLHAVTNILKDKEQISGDELNNI